MAILDMVERIREAWEKGEHCLGVFIDFRKAFDTVDHSILLSKELLRSYLSSRTQYVAFGSAESNQQKIAVGRRHIFFRYNGATNNGEATIRFVFFKYF